MARRKKSHNLGGTRRTMVCSCGLQKRGSLREVKMWDSLHRKKCKIASSCPALPKNAITGKNGWDGIRDGKVVIPQFIYQFSEHRSIL